MKSAEINSLNLQNGSQVQTESNSCHKTKTRNANLEKPSLSTKN